MPENAVLQSTKTIPWIKTVRPYLSILIMAVAFIPTGYLRGSWQTPLDEEEISRAASIAMVALVHVGQERKDSVAQSGGTADRALQADSSVEQKNRHPLGTQVLLIELREQKKQSDQAARVAEVFVFDYERGVAELNLVEVEQNYLISKQILTTPHLPLAVEEISYSKSLVWNNAEIRELIDSEIHKSGLLDLDDSTRFELPDLQTRVSIWVPNNPEQAGLSHCHWQRCALISLFTDSNYNFSVEPVVNLMSGDIFIDLIQ